MCLSLAEVLPNQHMILLVTYSTCLTHRTRCTGEGGGGKGGIGGGGGGGRDPVATSGVITHDAMSSDTICREERPEEWGWCHNKFRSALNHDGGLEVILTS